MSPSNAPRSGSDPIMTRVRVYCNGTLTKAQLAAKLDEGYVLIDVVRDGYRGGDVAYFRQGTPDEIEDCRRRMTAGASHD